MNETTKVIERIGDVGGIVFGVSGYSLATTELLETIFLALTIISVLSSLISRLIKSIVKVKKRHKELTKDGELSLDDVTELTDMVLKESELMGDEIKKGKGIIDEQRRNDKDVR